jgi:hypothetical protein
VNARILLLVCLLLLSGCSGGAVVFAPTPVPADLVPVWYTHPSGVFSLLLPRTWSLYEQNTTTLASAAFSAPDSDEPPLLFAVMNLGREIDSQEFGNLINLYQTQIRSDIETYTEQNREAMGDGSWRLTGARTVEGGLTEQVNTFIVREGTLIGVAEVILPANRDLLPLEQIVNTFSLQPTQSLEVSDLTTLAYAKPSSLSILHTSTWQTDEGIFFITGEVANYGTSTVASVPVAAGLLTADGLSAAGAVDIVMGHGIPPGGFAPFSLRFGQGQPSIASEFLLRIGNEPESGQVEMLGEAALIGAGELTWTDESSFDNLERLVISGEVSNNGGRLARQLRATVTVFDAAQHVIGAAFSDLSPGSLPPGETTAFSILLPDLGGEPANYIVNVQGLE